LVDANLVEPITRLLTLGDPGIASAAAYALAAQGIRAAPAVSRLISLARRATEATRAAAAWALGVLGLQPEESVTVLEEMLQENNRELNWPALQALAQLGLHAEPAVPRIEELLFRSLNQSDFVLGEEAARALAHIRPDAALRLEAIASRLDHEQRLVVEVELDQLRQSVAQVREAPANQIEPHRGRCVPTGGQAPTFRSEATSQIVG
jgi:HEAT repeat protein